MRKVHANVTNDVYMSGAWRSILPAKIFRFVKVNSNIQRTVLIIGNIQNVSIEYVRSRTSTLATRQHASGIAYYYIHSLWITAGPELSCFPLNPLEMQTKAQGYEGSCMSGTSVPAGTRGAGWKAPLLRIVRSRFSALASAGRPLR